VAVALGAVAAVVWWSGATLAGDAEALAHVELQPLGGSLVSAKAFRSDGAPIRLAVHNGRLLPTTLVSPGDRVSVVVVVRRPAWLRWALGRTRTVRLSLRAPTSRVTQQWPTVASGEVLKVRFDRPVDRVSYRSKTVSVGGRRIVSLGPQSRSGTLELASAARSWERLGPPTRVTWFPRAQLPVVLVDPPVGDAISPRAPIRLTFSQPVKKVLGSDQPRFASPVAGHWSSTDSHTLLFSPAGFGYPLASSVHLQLPSALSVSSGTASLTAARTIDWTIAGAQFIRLQQLLAEAGYLPLSWQPAAEPVARQPLAEITAAVSPPAGKFRWRYSNTPPELQRLWSTGEPNQITRGAVMMFQHDHDLAVDGVAGAQVWHALLTDAISGKTKTDGYSYVYVHRNVPQLLTLWHNGKTVLTSPGNTGVPAAPTQLGTFPVFEHIPVGTMSGTNPDGSHYRDPGIRWISYFNGGDALHSFTRASFGTPQSLGCVELPLATAARVWPYTPIGTLVTIEN
jgi:peptidoglycan hydrolase-like protein with peptidoglycan-binding domain